ncbi:diguanylate cyclase domain-containing protein [Shumkonia mesophila]|uniref:diguanylate cyclase domain-containing protein n=1 Tax=Shumkonia mesophila TaxID=2838854 RepID=UPI0029351D03|nr:diguanylate cyclase [Shumkonia mesophila]
MNRLGNILLHGTDPARTDRMSTLLTDSNCNVVICETADEVWEEARGSHPDLIVIDVGSLGRPGIATATALRQRKLENVPIVLWVAEEFAGLYDEALAARADDVFAGDVDATGAVELMTRMRPLMRLSTQLAEVRRRIALAREFGVPLPDDPDLSVGDVLHRVLAVGGSPALERRVSRALATRAERVDYQARPFEARDRLFEGDFDAVVMEAGEGISVEDALEFCNEVRNHPRLFNLPLLIIEEAPGSVPHGEAIRAGASLVLDHAAADDRLRYFLASYGRRQQIRWRIRDAIEATKTVRTRGMHTHSYMPGFLRSHLTALIGEARDWQKHLTVLVFSVAESLVPFREEFGEEAARELTRQVAQWISGLVRLEDVVANFGGGEFCVSLPDTPLDEAEAVIGRVTGILEYTDFAVKDVYRPVKVTVKVGWAELDADDDAGAMIARARQQME